MKSMVIIPTYNEKENIALITGQVLSLGSGFEVLIVDDNSPDGTGKIADGLAAKDTRVSVIHRAGKLGLGTAYISGFKNALQREDVGYIFEMDADFSHDPKDLLRIRDELERADVVVGSRYTGGIRVSEWKWGRLFISKAANVFVAVMTGTGVSDSTAGFVGYRRTVLESIDLNSIKSNGYAFQIEMKNQARRKGFTIKEIPIVFHGRKEGESKFDFGIIKEAFMLVLKLRFKRGDGK